MAVSERDLNDIQQKSEKMCREFSDARETRAKQFDTIPGVKDLRSQNETLRMKNEQLQQEVEYYKNYSKEKQAELFTLTKQKDELEVEVAEANNA